MNMLQQLRSLGIPITWATIEIGLDGPGSAGPQIDIGDVRAWLDDTLRDDNAPDGAVDVLVAIDGDNDPRAAIHQQAMRSSEDLHGELTKWQVVMLRRCLGDLPEAPFYAALAVADFWAQFGVHETPPVPSAEVFHRHLDAEDRKALVSEQDAWLHAAVTNLDGD
jgi:hypothetical protein